MVLGQRRALLVGRAQYTVRLHNARIAAAGVLGCFAAAVLNDRLICFVCISGFQEKTADSTSTVCVGNVFWIRSRNVLSIRRVSGRARFQAEPGTNRTVGLVSDSFDRSRFFAFRVFKKGAAVEAGVS
jgi:hypothetical protein